MADWTGKTLGRVQINDLIARGGMAEIYSGIHETYGPVAVKVMRGLLERDEHQLTRFKREAEVIGELHHPHIVRMLDFTIVDETPCLVMDYIPGPSLASYLKELHGRDQRIPIAIVAQVLRAIANAMDYAHNRGIIHRDIKPANILLRSPTNNVTTDQPLPLDVEPILTDFGLVRLLDSTLHTTTGSVSGTPTYMSPEQARGERLDKRTDIFPGHCALRDAGGLHPLPGRYHLRHVDETHQRAASAHQRHFHRSASPAGPRPCKRP
jgi:serine/threonine protein kinase